MDEKKRIYNENPLLSANFISRFFICWITPLLKLGRKKVINEDDLFKPVPSEEARLLTEKLEKEWEKELLKKKPSIIKALFRVCFYKILLASFLPFIEESIKVILPLVVAAFLRYFNNQIDLKWGLFYGSLIILGTLINNTIHHPYFLKVQRVGMRMRIAVSGLIYKKALRLSSFSKNTKGNLLNILSTDVSKIEYSVLFFPYLIIGPLQVLAIIIIFVSMVDLSILAGLSIIACTLPLQAVMTKLYNHFRNKLAKATDERISTLSEILNGIKIVKMYCWEESFKKKVDSIRKKELKAQSMLFLHAVISNSIDFCLPALSTYLSIAFFVRFDNKPLLNKYVVLAMSYYMRICSSIGFYFIRQIGLFVSAKIACERVQRYLLEDECATHEYISAKDSEKKVEVKNVSASWNEDQKSNFCLENISFKVAENELLAIVGPVGAGKSSLLLTLLKEIPFIKGDIEINGKVFYVSQEAWIFPSSIKQNILFGKEYEKERFNDVIKACNLKQDLKSFPSGENTIIGDKGVNLSGGQRARICLARALYYDADIYLLDDPLSAVDPAVASFLFQNCINGFLKNKIRILVTHQAHQLKNTQNIIVLENGEIQNKGSYDELLELESFRNLLMHNDELKEKKENEAFVPHRRFSEVSTNETERLVASQNLDFTKSHETNIEELEMDNENYEEKRESGKINWHIYKTFIKSGIGVIAPVLLLLIFIIGQFMINGADYCLSYWANAEEARLIYFRSIENCTITNNTTSNSDCHSHNLGNVINLNERQRFFTLYSIFIASSILISILRSVSFFGFCLLTSKSLHKSMLKSVLGTNVRFFDLNPVGRLLNRFSKDIANLDDVLPMTLFEFLDLSICAFAILFVAVWLNYWILIPMIPITVVFVYLRKYFLQTSRELKRVEALCRSPIYVHAHNTLTGITTIRACGNQPKILQEYYVHADYHTQAYFAFISVNRWFAVRLDFIVIIYTFFVVYGCIFAKDNIGLTPGQIGYLLTYLFQMLSLFQWTVRQSAEVENLMTSVERIIEYTNLESEGKDSTKKAPPNWPENGEIDFANVSFSYDKSLPNVLKNVNLNIRPGEKVGIVGRTGAGKSSFFQSLYRMAEPTGLIRIGGVNTKEITLHDLRSKLAIIPQEPTLFTGTIRSNLDPFNQNDDFSLWKALENVQLKEAVQSMSSGLDADVRKDGSNLSVGQKQLFCLARAIIRKPKILIIDEATANVDYNTDALVQKAIRECFKDCTVLTIAHRLQTVMDNDKIICLSNGELINFGKPFDLLNDTNSILYEMAQKLGKSEFQKLLKIAESAMLNCSEEESQRILMRRISENLNDDTFFLDNNDSIEAENLLNSTSL